MRAKFVTRASKGTIPVHPLTPEDLEAWKKAASPAERSWVEAARFAAKPAEVVVVPGAGGAPSLVLLGLGADPNLWAFGALSSQLPKGRYQIHGLADATDATAAALGFALGAYAFDRYKEVPEPDVELVWPEGADRAQVARLADSTELVRDLINTPAEDMGPAQLAEVVQQVAKAYGARVSVIEGAQLLKKNYPAVHAVGRAASADRAPRLIDLRWGKAKDPKVTLVGKGVVFDSGGLDIKPASGMLIMKKDMGGSAIALGLARAIMDAKLPVRLRLLIPAVENAISGNAFRPLDVLQTRKGLTVEVGNTDAEGRLILCDALAEACTESPELLIDFATLTGAARVALGTEIPVMFSNDDNVAEGILAAGEEVDELVWRLPLHAGYRRHLDSKVADISNTASSSYGGAITAALFLQSFVDDGQPWAHFDVMAYNLDGQPGRPPGGEAMGLRAVFDYLQSRYGG
jgi:leucyl aminopeptidase